MKQYTSSARRIAVLALGLVCLIQPRLFAQTREEITAPVEKQSERIQAEKADRSRRSEALLKAREETRKRDDALLKREEEAMTRYEKILETWERQQKEYQKYLDTLPKK